MEFEEMLAKFRQKGSEPAAENKNKGLEHSIDISDREVFDLFSQAKQVAHSDHMALLLVQTILLRRTRDRLADALESGFNNICQTLEKRRL